MPFGSGMAAFYCSRLRLLVLPLAFGADVDDADGVCNAHGRPTVHAAFYLWYGNPESDGRWMHWNHKVLPHWDPREDARHPKFEWRPPDEPHSPYMPLRGTYSCRDNETLQAQFRELTAAGIDSAMCSWWGRKDWVGKRDDAFSGANTDELMPAVLEAARQSGTRVSFHIEPYGGRTPETFLDDLRYIHMTYGSHPAVYRDPKKNLPLFWLYDVSAEHSKDQVHAWRRALDSVRGTALDGVFMCLWIGDRGDLDFVEQGGFDGAYTYFAAAGFTPGSNPNSWKRARADLKLRGKFFVPAVGPGYDDKKIRPWNAHNVRPREDGAYYDRMWRAATLAEPYAISVTSYNEWGEGTQIEAARPHQPPSLPDGSPQPAFLDYGDSGPDFYLQKTKHWAEQFKASSCHGQ